MSDLRLIKNQAYLAKSNEMILHGSDKHYILKIKDLPEELKPREKMAQYGADILSTRELLAIILAVGTRREEVMSMSSRILKEYGEKNITNQTNPKQLAKELKIPLTKACQIVAAFELGRRFFKENKGGAVTIRTAKQAYQYLTDMRDLPKEQLRGLYLNSRNRLVHEEVISIGSLTANIVHPREVFKPAIIYSAAAIIIAHNHPSGSVKATSSDILVTEQLIKAGKILGVDLLDHIIITKSRFSSVPAKY